MKQDVFLGRKSMLMPSINVNRGALAQPDIFNVGYEHPDQGDNPLPDLAAGADLSLTQMIAQKLNEWKETRGPIWRVEVSHEQGYVKIQIPALMKDSTGYVVHLSRLESDPSFKCIKMGCSELLERFSIPRTGLREADLWDAIMRHPLGYRGLYRGGTNPVAK